LKLLAAIVDLRVRIRILTQLGLPAHAQAQPFPLFRAT